MKNEIRYFSMFTGVGGFELGLNACNQYTNEECESAKPNQDVSLREREIISKVSWGTGWIGDVNQEGGSVLPTGDNGMRKFSCVGMSEWDKYSSQVLKYQFPTIKNWGDCTKINPSELPDFDMLCGGFPCQAFSIAGKRKGFEDTRGTMFFEVARILKVKRPKIALLENVKGLLNHNKGQTFSVILEALDELGYEVQWMVLNSKFFGVPQNRERVLIIGSLRGERKPEILPFRESCGWNDVKDCSATITSSYKKGCNNHNQLLQLNNPTHSNNRIYGEDGVSPALNTARGGNRQPKIRAVLTPDRPEKRQNGRRFKEEGEPSFTLTGQDIHGICKTVRSGGRGSLTKKHEWDVIREESSIRRLTPVECCRLQGFQDDWNEYGIDEQGKKVKMSDTQRYRQMGNAVTTNVIKAVGEKILASHKACPTEKN